MRPIEEILKEFDRRGDERNYMDNKNIYQEPPLKDGVDKYCELDHDKVRAFIEQALIERDKEWKGKIINAVAHPAISDEIENYLYIALLDN